MTTPGTASSTDARKRQAERETSEQPPQFPDMTGWVKCEPGDVIKAGTPYAYVGTDGASFSYNTRDRDWNATTPGAYWTPPPAPVWSVISTDRDRPTLARVTLNLEDDGYDTAIGSFWADADGYLILGRVSTFAHRSCVEGVELLHTHDPETHVPVERALIDEAVQIADSFDVDPAWPFRFVEKIAALADGAES